MTIAFWVSLAVGGAAALLCLAAMLVWVIGTPGVENEYARGWAIGFQALAAYIVIWLAGFVLVVVPYLFLKGRASPGFRSWFEWGCVVVTAIIIVVTVGRLAYAIDVMGRK